MKTLIALTVGLVVLCGFVVWAGVKDEEAWESYSVVHHCAAVGTKAAQVGTGITSSGKVATTYVPEQTIYRCDTGEIVIR